MKHIRQATGLVPQPVRFGLRRLAYRGTSVACVLCGSQVRGLVGHGGGPEVLDRRQVVGGMRREDDRCPVCHACDRTRMLMLYLSECTGVGRRPQRILHVAPDFGLYLWLRRQPQVDYVGSDIDASRYRHIENMRTADLTEAPFEDAAFDVIICSHVLEHIPDDRAAMRELLRVLKPGGHALLLTPFALDGRPTDEGPSVVDPGARERRFGQWDHVRIYSKHDFLDRLVGTGFAADWFEPFTSMPVEAERLHLNPREPLAIGRKSA